jgi:stage II sporulation protein GA (sporulation sigma-E factor processing peptidase)
MQVIYADILFMINFSADYLALYLTGKILCLRPRRIRLILAALIGAIYALPAMLFVRQAWLLLFLSAAVLCLMVWISFCYTGLRRYLRAILATLLISCLLAGAITLLYRGIAHLTRSLEIEADTGGKLLVFLLLSLLSGGIILLANRLAGIGRAGNVSVTVTVGERRKTLLLLSDNACFLREPLSGKPVIILSVRGAEGLLPTALLEAEEGAIPMLHGNDRRRYYTIPYHTVGGKRLMHGYRPDRIELRERGKTKSLSALIGLGDRQTADYQGCDGIIPASLAEL